jgi:hypothetical protein
MVEGENLALLLATQMPHILRLSRELMVGRTSIYFP